MLHCEFGFSTLSHQLDSNTEGVLQHSIFSHPMLIALYNLYRKERTGWATLLHIYHHESCGSIEIVSVIFVYVNKIASIFCTNSIVQMLLAMLKYIYYNFKTSY